MTNTSPNQIQYAGRKWTLIIEVLIDDMNMKDPQKVFTLDGQGIIKFKYSNAFNNLCLFGEIEYQDQYGQIDKLLDRQFSYFQVRFIQHKQKSDGGITLEKFDDGSKFYHTFLANSIQIMERNNNSILYKIKLISANWFNCSSNIMFTNYHKAPETIFDILKQCIKKSEMDFDKESFDRIKTQVKINYITNGNDNLFSITKFLLNRLYYYDIKDDSIKTLIFNETMNKFQLFDFKQAYSTNGFYTIVVSMFKSQTEGMMEEEPNQLATIVDFKACDYIKNVYNYQVSDYTYNKNEFINNDFNNESIINYLNNKSPSNTYSSRNKLPFIEFNGIQRHTYWNNQIDIYEQTIEQQLKMNSLVLNTSPEILRKPGSMISISTDRSTLQVDSQNHKDLEDMKKRYLGIEGSWIISKVINIIEPRSQRYRQNLTLSRNYMLYEEKKD